MSKSKKKTKRKTQSTTTEDSPPKKLRYIRGTLGLVIVAVIIITIGSYVVRTRVVDLVRLRALSTSSVVLSRPISLQAGFSFLGQRIESRLKRLGYREVRASPKKPGDYRVTQHTVELYTKGGQLPDAKELLPENVILSLNDRGEIKSIENRKYGQPISQIWIEPEPVSVLGNGIRRASSPLELSEFPKQLIDCLLGVEDDRFYSHYGIDPLAVLRAMYVNIRKGRVVQGASTLTQQLAKNFFLSPERSLKRKLSEAVTAIFIETAFSKDQILEMYLNEVFLAQEGNIAIHGFAEASRSFFSKDISQLNLSEIATLVGLVKAPSRYSPRFHPKSSKKRRDSVLKLLNTKEIISNIEYSEAKNQAISVAPPKHSRRNAPYFVDFIRKELLDQIPVDSSNTKPVHLHTGLDAELQLCAEKAVKQGLEKLEKRFSRLKKNDAQIQAALVSIDPTGGEILAWVGGRNYGKNQFDRVSMAKRQPGSAFKPFVFLTAIDGKLNSYRTARTTSLLIDEPTDIPLETGETWQPRNYSREYRGEVTVREALAYSLNVPTVDLAMKVGISSIAETASLFGFGDNLPEVPSLALGAGEVTPLELVRAYAAIANGGRLLELRPVISVTQPELAEPLFQATLREWQAASESAVFVLTDILRTAVEHGTGRVVRRMGFKRPVAGKTGTTNDSRDVWFTGFTPKSLTVVWVGFDDNRSTKLTGASGAAPIWVEYMKCAQPMEPELDFIPPPGVVYRNIDRASGLLWTEYCDRNGAVQEIFVKGTEPVTRCDRRFSNPPGFIEPPDDYKGRPANRPMPPTRQKRRKGFWDSLFG